jgi:hypothetical protein
VGDSDHRGSRAVAGALFHAGAAQGRAEGEDARRSDRGGNGAHYRRRHRRAAGVRFLILGCFAEPVIGPATSGRTRWRFLSGNDEPNSSAPRDSGGGDV